MVTETVRSRHRTNESEKNNILMEEGHSKPSFITSYKQQISEVVWALLIHLLIENYISAQMYSVHWN